MTRVQQDAFRGGERDTQHHRRPPPIGLPDIAGDRLRLRRAILSTEPMWCRIEVERQHVLLWLRPDVGATHVAGGEGGAVDQSGVDMKLEKPGVITRAATKPMPDQPLRRP